MKDMAGVLLAEVHFLNGFKGLYLSKTSVARGLRIDFMFGWWVNVDGTSFMENRG